MKDWGDYIQELIPSPINKQNNFVAAWKHTNVSVLNDINDYFEQRKTEGTVNKGLSGEGEVNLEVKDSWDVTLQDNMDLYDRYLDEILSPALSAYLRMYPFADAVNRFSVRRSINIQEYLPSSNGYKRWHCEVDGTHNLRRHLVFMTYLNDVSDGGETLFYHQDLAIKPEFGTTVIFPPTWTHQHKGLSSPSEHKRFLTGWFEFYNEIPKDEVDSSDKVSW